MIEKKGLTVLVNNTIIAGPILFLKPAVTNVSGIARVYLTRDGTVSGDPIFRTVYGANIGVEYSSPVFYNTTISGLSYVEVLVRQQQFNLITILGISVLGSVNMSNVVGAVVKFVVIGD